MPFCPYLRVSRIVALCPAVLEATAAGFASLGLTTLGEVAALPVGAVIARLGAEGLRAHKLATLDHRPFSMVSPRQGCQPSPA